MSDGAITYSQWFTLYSTTPATAFLREWRKDRRLSLAGLSTMAGMDLGAVSRYESGAWPITLECLTRFALALDCQPSDLLHPPPGLVE